VCKPLDAEMLLDAARHSLIVTVEDGIRTGGVGSAIALGVGELSEDHVAPPVVVLGVPSEYIPHGKPDQILAELGLDAAGIAAAVVKARANTTV
jgi:1-deoxy-D-xylulose-5-phosphate synthase